MINFFYKSPFKFQGEEIEESSFGSLNDVEVV